MTTGRDTATKIDAVASVAGRLRHAVVAASAMTALAGPEARQRPQHLAHGGCRAAASVVPLGVLKATRAMSR